MGWLQSDYRAINDGRSHFRFAALLFVAQLSCGASGWASDTLCLLGTARVAEARRILLYGRGRGQVGQRHWAAHRTRGHPCANGRLRHKTLESAQAASWSAEDRRRKPPGIDLQTARWDSDQEASRL